MAQEKELIFVFDIQNILEAQYFSGIFKDEGIPFHLKSFYDRAYDGLFTAQKGYGKMFVPKEYEEQALKLYNDHKNES